MVHVRIPDVLVDLADGQREVGVDADTVSAVISALDERFPGMSERLMDESGLRRYITIYVNGDDVRYGESLHTSLRPEDRVWILPTSSGGMAAR